MRTARKTAAPDESSGGILVATDGRSLPLQGTSLKVEAQGGIARTVLEQRFENPYDDPLAVTYLLPLPHDGAVSAFAFRIGERRIVGEVDRRSAARERFEQALVEGRSAALVEQERASLFTQEIGNIPPRAAVVAEITLDQRLAWLAEGAWEYRFPTTVASRYQGGPGRVADSARLNVPVADGPIGPRLTLALSVRDAPAQGRSPESPSHALHFTQASGLLRASMRDESGAPLDRDLVVRWPVAAQAVGLSLSTARPDASKPHARHAYGLLTLVPPRSEAGLASVPRDLIVLLDTSGSMGGEPLDQARRVVSALIDTLGPQDRLELIEFSNAPRRWRKKAAEASLANRKAALEWLAALEAGGGTEMRSGVYEALAALREGAQRQVVLVTDGLIGFESEVLRTILEKLPFGSRLHAVGVGSAVNRSLTGPAARAGHGVEVVIGLGEDPERAAMRLSSRTAEPLVTELEIRGSALVECAPARLPDLFGGAPAIVALALSPEGGRLEVTGRTARGRFEQTLQVRPVPGGEGSPAAIALFGREKVEDLEMRAAAGEAGEHDGAIERLGLEFQIATRLTSWIAVSDRVDVDPTRPTRREKMPHALPYGMSAEGLGLRPAVAGMAPMGQAIAYGAVREMAAAPSLKLRAGSPAPASPPSPSPAQAASGFVGDRLRKAGDVAKKMKGEVGGPAGRGRSQPPSEPKLYAPEDGLAPGERFESAHDAEMDWKEDKPAPRRAGFEGARDEARRLAGRVVLFKGKELVVEVAVDGGALPWEPPVRVRVAFEDGVEIEVEVDPKRTTAAMSISEGQVIRLALVLAAEAAHGPPRRVRLGDGTSTLVIELAGP
jgi:Ca-activated chloride channel family protein